MFEWGFWGNVAFVLVVSAAVAGIMMIFVRIQDEDTEETVKPLRIMRLEPKDEDDHSIK